MMKELFFMKNRYGFFMFIFVPYVLQAIEQNDTQSKLKPQQQVIFKIYNRPVFDMSNESISNQDVKNNTSPEITTTNVGEISKKPTEKEKSLNNLVTLGAIASYVFYPPIMIGKYITGAVIYKVAEDSTSFLQNQYSYYFTTKKEEK